MKAAIDLMGTGLDTSSTTLMWVILYLVCYPEVQEKCYKGMEENIGDSRVNLEDILNEFLYFVDRSPSLRDM